MFGSYPLLRVFLGSAGSRRRRWDSKLGGLERRVGNSLLGGVSDPNDDQAAKVQSRVRSTQIQMQSEMRGIPRRFRAGGLERTTSREVNLRLVCASRNRMKSIATNALSGVPRFQRARAPLD